MIVGFNPLSISTINGVTPFYFRDLRHIKIEKKSPLKQG